MKKLVFLGAGNMVDAILNGIMNSNQEASTEYLLYSPTGKSAKALGEKYQIPHTDNSEDCRGGDYYVFACKPQQLGELGKAFSPIIPPDAPIITLLTSVNFASYRGKFPTQPIVRVMPNTPASVGEGLTTLIFTENCNNEFKQFSNSLFEKVGSVFVLEKEAQMDLLTPFNGSGPGLLFFIAEQLHAELTNLGVEKKQAYQVISQVFLGSSRLMLASLEQGQSSFKELRDQVTSKGGVTQAAIHSMIESGLDVTLKKSIQVAIARSREITAATSA